MAKVMKKKGSTKPKKIVNKKQKSFDLDKLFERFQIKDCRVLLNRVISRHIYIKVKQNTLSFNGNSIKPSEKKSNGIVYNLTLNVKLNELVNHQCNVIESSSKPFGPKTLAAESDGAWRAAKKTQGNNNGNLSIGQTVIAKMKSYAPWPAQIKGFSKNLKRAEVFFFGTSNSGMVGIDEIVDIMHARDVMRLLLLRKIPSYAKAVGEMERVCGIPHKYSLLREILAIGN